MFRNGFILINALYFSHFFLHKWQQRHFGWTLSSDTFQKYSNKSEKVRNSNSNSNSILIAFKHQIRIRSTFFEFNDQRVDEFGQIWSNLVKFLPCKKSKMLFFDKKWHFTPKMKILGSIFDLKMVKFNRIKIRPISIFQIWQSNLVKFNQIVEIINIYILIY